MPSYFIYLECTNIPSSADGKDPKPYEQGCGLPGQPAERLGAHDAPDLRPDLWRLHREFPSFQESEKLTASLLGHRNRRGVCSGLVIPGARCRRSHRLFVAAILCDCKCAL